MGVPGQQVVGSTLLRSQPWSLASRKFVERRSVSAHEVMPLANDSSELFCNSILGRTLATPADQWPRASDVKLVLLTPLNDGQGLTGLLFGIGEAMFD